MSNCTWVIQDNLRQVNDGVDGIIRACESEGVPYELVQVVPFADEIVVKAKSPVVFFGSTSLRALAMKGGFTPGVFYHENSLDFERLLERYGTDLLNYNSILDTVGHFLEFSKENFIAEPENRQEEIFLRPAGDTKEVTGGVKTVEEWVQELESAMGVRYGVTGGTLIQVVEPRKIPHEWRFFIVGTEPVAWCQSRVDHKLCLSQDVPYNVVKWVKTLVAGGGPEDVYVMDVCKVDGEYKVIELNTMNCAGLYLCDPVSIVRSVTKLVNQKYGAT